MSMTQTHARHMDRKTLSGRRKVKSKTPTLSLQKSCGASGVESDDKNGLPGRMSSHDQFIPGIKQDPYHLVCNLSRQRPVKPVSRYELPDRGHGNQIWLPRDAGHPCAETLAVHNLQSSRIKAVERRASSSQTCASSNPTPDLTLERLPSRVRASVLAGRSAVMPLLQSDCSQRRQSR